MELDLSEIPQLREQGKTLHEIAKALGVSHTTLSKNLKEQGIVMPKQYKPSSNQIRNYQILAFYLENNSLDECGKKFGGLTRERVRQILNAMGVKPRMSSPIVIRETLSNDRPHRYTTKERFWSNVDIHGEDDCWEWQAGRYPSGYGNLSCTGLGEQYSHRIAFILGYRKRPKNHVLHSCDNPPCCNPKHLRDGTPQDNMHDRNTRGREKWLDRLREARAIYSETDIKTMVKLRAAGMTYTAIADKFGTTQPQISTILNGKRAVYKKYLEKV